MQGNEIHCDSNMILKYAVEHNIINVADIQNQIKNMKKTEYLEMHNHKVWRGKNGKWYTYVDDSSQRGYSLRVRDTEDEIENVIVKYYKDKESNPYIYQVFETWNKQRLEFEEISPQSYNRYANDFKRFFPKDNLLCQKKMRSITENDLEIFIKSTIRKFGMTNKMYSGMRTLIRGIFKYGKKHGYTAISITTFFGDLDLSKKLFKRKVVRKKDEVFNEDEVKLIKEYLRKSKRIRDLGILLAFETGARVGELSAVKKEDISLNKKIIHIQRTEITYKEPETDQRVCEVRDFPKSEAGDRYLIIPDSASETIEEIIRLNPDGEYLFMENGNRIRANAFNRRLTRVCDNLHIDHKSMHKVRKTYGTTLIDQGVDESLVVEQMGHKDISTTKKYYYFNNKNEDAKIKQINEALACVNN